jgi:hypothetical protein
MNALNGLRASAALDQLARDLYVHHCEYEGAPIEPWTDLPQHIRRMYVEVSARTLNGLSQPEPIKTSTGDALFHLATQLARAEFVTGLRPTHGNVIGYIPAKSGQ